MNVTKSVKVFLLDFIPPFLAMRKLKQAWLCSLGLTKTLIFLISFSFIVRGYCNTIPKSSEWTSEHTDAEKLSRAVDYFQSGKYHEALIWFSKLDKKYTLNPRFQAYMGVCCYYDGEYEQAIDTLEPILSKLEVFAPHELAVYYYCVADSYFRLKKYIDAVPLFEKHTLLCYNDEKGDSLFRIGLCYKNLGDIEIAQEYFVEALAYFRNYNNQDRLNYIERELENGK